MTPSFRFRFLWLVAAPRSYLIVVLGALAAFGLCLEFLEPGSSESVVAGILIVQLFAASTGFTNRASWGFFDPVLTSGASRAEVALLHFAVSAAPGAASWIFVGLVQVLRSGSLDVIAFRPAGLAALLLVSSISWASTLRLPTFSAGGLWLTISIGLLVSGAGMKWFGQLRVDPAYLVSHPRQGILFGLLFPLFVPAMPFPAGAVLVFGAVSALAVAGGVLFIRRADIALAEDE